jgi:hypothetical protein
MNLVGGSRLPTQELRDLAESLWLQHGTNAKHFVAEQLDRALEADNKAEYATWVGVARLLVDISARPIKPVHPECQ